MNKESSWRKHVEAWASGKQSKRVYCKEHGLNVHTFDYWRGKLKRGSREEKFVELTSPSQFELNFPGGVTVRVPNDFKEESLSRLIGILRGS